MASKFSAALSRKPTRNDPTRLVEGDDHASDDDGESPSIDGFRSPEPRAMSSRPSNQTTTPDPFLALRKNVSPSPRPVSEVISTPQSEAWAVFDNPNGRNRKGSDPLPSKEAPSKKGNILTKLASGRVKEDGGRLVQEDTSYGETEDSSLSGYSPAAAATSIAPQTSSIGGQWWQSNNTAGQTVQPMSSTSIAASAYGTSSTRTPPPAATAALSSQSANWWEQGSRALARNRTVEDVLGEIDKDSTASRSQEQTSASPVLDSKPSVTSLPRSDRELDDIFSSGTNSPVSPRRAVHYIPIVSTATHGSDTLGSSRERSVEQQDDLWAAIEPTSPTKKTSIKDLSKKGSKSLKSKISLGNPASLLRKKSSKKQQTVSDEEAGSIEEVSSPPSRPLLPPTNEPTSPLSARQSPSSVPRPKSMFEMSSSFDKPAPERPPLPKPDTKLTKEVGAVALKSTESIGNSDNNVLVVGDASKSTRSGGFGHRRKNTPPGSLSTISVDSMFRPIRPPPARADDGADGLEITGYEGYSEESEFQQPSSAGDVKDMRRSNTVGTLPNRPSLPMMSSVESISSKPDRPPLPRTHSTSDTTRPARPPLPDDTPPLSNSNSMSDIRPVRPPLPAEMSSPDLSANKKSPARPPLPNTSSPPSRHSPSRPPLPSTSSFPSDNSGIVFTPPGRPSFENMPQAAPVVPQKPARLIGRTQSAEPTTSTAQAVTTIPRVLRVSQDGCTTVDPNNNNITDVQIKPARPALPRPTSTVMSDSQDANA